MLLLLLLLPRQLYIRTAVYTNKPRQVGGRDFPN